MGTTFKDHFSTNSSGYADFRPSYPDEVFAWLAQHSPSRGRALDVATGTGQAATALAEHFDRVDAVDGSANQINAAAAHSSVTYSTATAENLPFGDNRFDLITVAQALHWFDFEAFFSEVARVAKPGALLAVLGYSFFRITPKIDAALKETVLDVVDSYWPPENQILWNLYRDVSFPFDEVKTPGFAMKVELTVDGLFDYLLTWSAVKSAIADQGKGFLNTARAAIERDWPGDAALPLDSETIFRAFRVP